MDVPYEDWLLMTTRVAALEAELAAQKTLVNRYTEACINVMNAVGELIKEMHRHNMSTLGARDALIGSFRPS